MYRERDEHKREEFLQGLKDISGDKIVWVDECGVEERIQRLYARSLQGRRVFADTSGKKTHNRLSVIAAYCGKKLIAPFRFQGYTNTDVFETWIEKCLIPLLVAGQIVVLDNAAFHKSLSIQS